MEMISRHEAFCLCVLDDVGGPLSCVGSLRMAYQVAKRSDRSGIIAQQGWK